MILTQRKKNKLLLKELPFLVYHYGSRNTEGTRAMPINVHRRRRHSI
jgi:hypothetical protein